MNKFKNGLIGLALFLSLAFVGVLLSSRQGGAQNPHASSSVEIISPLPLPVTVNLSLQPGGTVNVGNTAASPVPVRDVDSTRQPFQTGSSFYTAFAGGANSTIVQVPAHKRLLSSTYLRISGYSMVRRNPAITTLT